MAHTRPTQIYMTIHTDKINRSSRLFILYIELLDVCLGTGLTISSSVVSIVMRVNEIFKCLNDIERCYTTMNSSKSACTISTYCGWRWWVCVRIEIGAIAKLVATRTIERPAKHSKFITTTIACRQVKAQCSFCTFACFSRTPPSVSKVYEFTELDMNEKRHIHDFIYWKWEKKLFHWQSEKRDIDSRFKKLKIDFHSRSFRNKRTAICQHELRNYVQHILHRT